MRRAPELPDADFERWRQLLETRAGMVLDDRQRSFLQIQLAARMRELAIADYDSYYQVVCAGIGGRIEWVRLLDRLTIQATRFFRHPPSFALLETYVNEFAKTAEGDSLTLWSLGCASGEEAFSMAISTAEVLTRQTRPLTFALTGTDISSEALRQARQGIYSLQRLAGMPAALRERYFSPRGGGNFEVAAGLAERLCFARLNVLELGQAPLQGLNVIFCQNLLIYFRRWLRRDLLNQLVERLAPGGLLVLGVGEVSNWSHPQLIPVDHPEVLAFTRQLDHPA
ncbi:MULTISPECIES: protein-glutamate O-methyltransferase CheR [unclassified Pseudomonas]|uniref:CheR family methyltransferase n=1 Tax=unclassified Pseudomonas TaxID=196821 RepID=UPI00131DD7E2|nr:MULTISPECIES: CheR family methyltransferase [unclassified Pseudomonas]